MNIDVDISKTVLKTERTVLRTFRLSDLDDFYEYASVDGVGQMAGWSPHKDKNESLGILIDFIDEKKTFAVTLGGKVIGSIGIERYDEELFSEFADKKGRSLGFVLGMDYWGKGIMPEAAEEVLRYMFEDLKLDFVTCGYFTFNTRSARVQIKLGFKPYARTIIKTRYGTEELTMENILTKEEYFSRGKE